MLKRYQVLLPDWLEEYVKFLAEKYDVSFSEIIRAQICLATLTTINQIFPNYKTEIEYKDILKAAKENLMDEFEREEIHRMISRLYFETRKAVEFRFAQEKKKKKK